MMKRTSLSRSVIGPRARSAALARKCDCGNHAAGGTCPACADERKKRRVSRYAERSAAAPTRNGAASAGVVPPIVHEVLRGPGQGLPNDVRAFMEPRFGADFSDVRVHIDDKAARSSRAVSARAYTVGPDVVFGAGQYTPATDAGRRLIAHELSHVVQQRSAGVSRTAAPETISDPSDASEREADAVADRVASQPPRSHAPVRAETGTPPVAQPGAGVQRQLSTEALTGIGVGVGIAGAVGAGLLIAWGAGAFDRDTYSTEELLTYLNGLATRRRHEGERNSDNKARDVVRHWQARDPKLDVAAGHTSTGGALTPVELKRLLIAEMLDGRTTGADEEAILTILERSTPDDLLQIVDPAKGVSVNQLNDKIGGANNDRLQALLDEKFPSGSKVRAQQDASCRGARGVMVFVARDAAAARVGHAIAALDHPEDPAVRRALDCRFRGASAAQIAGIKALFERVRTLLPSRKFYCLRLMEELSFGGEPVRCMGEQAATWVSRGGDIPQIALCDQFFGADPEAQAVTIIHETAHSAGLRNDIRTHPPCGWDLGLALQEPDSYALLASDLFAAQANAPAAFAPAQPPQQPVR